MKPDSEDFLARMIILTFAIILLGLGISLLPVAEGSDIHMIEILVVLMAGMVYLYIAVFSNSKTKKKIYLNSEDFLARIFLLVFGTLLSCVGFLLIPHPGALGMIIGGITSFFDALFSKPEKIRFKKKAKPEIADNEA